jgi:hypothetical protein
MDTLELVNAQRKLDIAIAQLDEAQRNKYRHLIGGDVEGKLSE